MADRILHSVARMNRVVEQVVTGDTIHDLISQYATAALYNDPEKLPTLAKKIMAKARTQFIPLANSSGIRSADELLVGIERKVIAGQERRLSAMAKSRLRTETEKNLANLSDGLKSAQLELRASTVSELRRARFGQESRRQVMDRITKADKADLESWSKYQTEHRTAVKAEAQALDRLSKAKTPRDADLVAVKEAQDAQKAARRRMLARRSFLARFENATARELTDTMRVQTRLAQDARFRELGYDATARMTWITVNGAGTCPDCSPMHGVTKTNAEWDGSRPGSGWTVCGASCMCGLVPVAYSVGNDSVSEPLLAPKTPRDRSPIEVPKSKTPLPKK